MVAEIGEVTRRGSPGPATLHALRVRSAIATGDYVAFFGGYASAPNLSSYLIDLFIDRERVITLKKLTRAVKPTLPITLIAQRCGFTHTTGQDDEAVKEASAWVRGLGVVITGGVIDCKAAYAVLVARVEEMQRTGVDIKGQIH